MGINKSLKGLNPWQQVSLLLLNQHRPPQSFLQTPKASMPLSTREKNPRRTIRSQVMQGLKAGLGQRWAINEYGFRLYIELPRRPTATVPIGWKQPEVVQNLLRRSA